MAGHHVMPFAVYQLQPGTNPGAPAAPRYAFARCLVSEPLRWYFGGDAPSRRAQAMPLASPRCCRAAMLTFISRRFDAEGAFFREVEMARHAEARGAR